MVGLDFLKVLMLVRFQPPQLDFAMSFNGRIRLFESLNVGSIPAIAIDSEGMRIGKRAVLNTVALTG